MNTQYFILKDIKLNLPLKLNIVRYKNGNIKSWNLWSYYLENGEYKRGVFIANQNTSVLALIRLFKNYELTFEYDTKSLN